MTPSTPKKDKLYGYLEGFESVCFTGSSKGDVSKSIKDLLIADLSVFGLELTNWRVSNYVNRVSRLIDAFMTEYYQIMKSIKDDNPDRVVRLANGSKEDLNTLLELHSLLMSAASSPVDGLHFCKVIRAEVRYGSDLCETCPYFVKRKFCLFSTNSDDDSINPTIFKFNIACYRLLACALLQTFHFLVKVNGVDMSQVISYDILFEDIATAGHIFELMNPSGKARQDMLDKAESLLTQEPLDVNSPVYKHYDGILDAVFLDLDEGKLPYIQDLRQALDKSISVTMSPYDPVKDAYLSFKGSAQSVETKQRYSLLSSTLETDKLAHIPEVQVFDEHVGFISHYPISDDGTSPKMGDALIRTIGINNPGKFKIRIIHLGDNPTQDRCNYIQRRVANILDHMVCDCTKDQDKGRNFLKLLTLKWAIASPDEKPGIYGFDFSNATDTLDQHFQYRVLEKVLGHEVADFWQVVSDAPKLIQDVKGNYKRYDQKCGQPQGLLGSFPSFALAHHFIFLMDMKVLGMENIPSWDFYRVLGDDSICSSVNPEIDIYDPDGPKDDCGISRSTIEMCHFEICKNFAGFQINYSKSCSTHYNSGEAKLDFAKVTYRNGQLFTPTPFRLAMNFSKNEASRIAVAIWRGERGDPNSIAFMDYVLRYSCGRTGLIIKGGFLPYFDKFRDEKIHNNESFSARVRYASALAILSASLSFLTLNDKQRSRAQYGDILTDACRRLISKKLLGKINDIDPQHKIWQVLERNGQISHIMKEIYEYDELDDKILALALGVINENFMDDKLFDAIYNLGNVSKILRDARKHPEVDIFEVFPDFDRSLTPQLKRLADTLITRSISNRCTEQSVLLESILSILDQLDDILGYIPGTKGEI